MSAYIGLDYTDIAIAAILVVINGAASIAFQLGLERRLFIAAVRMVVQLFLVGLVLKALFALVSPLWTSVAALVMLTVAGREILARQNRRLTGWWGYGLGATTMTTAAALVTMFALTTQISPDPWYHPRYALPLFGMVLGNTMTGISLGMDTLTTSLARERAVVETRLTLGHTILEAIRPYSRHALRTALTPTVNTMAATGIVALPGMMTGQILSGVDPVEAVKYQILVIFLIAGGTGIGALMAVIGTAKRLGDARHRLRLDRLGNARE